MLKMRRLCHQHACFSLWGKRDGQTSFDPENEPFLYMQVCWAPLSKVYSQKYDFKPDCTHVFF